MKLSRSALMVGLVAIGVGACGDDVQVVEPTPPPPPLTATMAPASATVAVGSNVVFAVNASGGAAGAQASWTCASSNTGIATASNAGAGCQVTGVAAGGVTITAAVTKGSETLNVGAQLTVTTDEVVGTVGEPAFIFISPIGATGQQGVQPGSAYGGRLDVAANIDRGDQTLESVALLVDGEVVASQSFLSSPAMTPGEGDEPAEQAGIVLTLSFDTDAYDEIGTPKYMNGTHTLQAQLTIAGGMMANGMMGHETILSNEQPVEFKNTDGVHVIADFPGNKAMNPKTGEIWYGGPGGSTFAITVRPVMFSGGAVESVGIRNFCDADLATKAEAPYEFEIDCEGKSGSETPEFVLSVGGQTLAQSDSQARNDTLFPINLDFEGPEIPVFKVNPNGREGGWINEAVKLTGKYSGTSNKDGWLTYGASDEGVGGYIAQLRYSTSDPRVAASARAAAPSTSPELPAATSSTSKICFVVSATDLLGNQSALPKATADCVSAAVYAPLAKAYRDAVKAVADAEKAGNDPTADKLKDVTDTRGKVLVGFQAGVDITAPTAEFARSGLDEDAREIDDEFEVIVEDNSGGSGIQSLKTNTAGDAFVNTPLIASLEVRDTKATKCVNGGKVQTSPSLCVEPLDGIEYDAGDDRVMTNVVETVLDELGYYTFTARAQDKAGNLSEEINRVALRDEEFEADAGVRVTHGTGGTKVFAYTVDISVRDDLSVRDYYLAMDLGVAVISDGPSAFRLGSVEEVDAYNASELTTVLDVTEKPKLPFLALQLTNQAEPTEIEDIQVYVRDQRKGNQVDDPASLYALDDDDADVDDLTAANDDNIEGVTSFEVVANEPMYDDNDDIELIATVIGAADLDVPFKRVYFYAESTNGGTAVEDWRLIGSLRGSDYDDDTAAGRYDYTLELGSDEVLAIMVDDEEEKDDYAMGRIIAIGVKDDIPEVPAVVDNPDTADDDETAAKINEIIGKVGLVSTGTVPTITINR